MIKTYSFLGEDSLEFDDSRSVKDLVEYAFDTFGYYEPFGMDAVTVYQYDPSHRFVIDSSLKCRDVLNDGNRLCFAYFVPETLYYVEGGWGHHMHELVGHPDFKNPVSLKLKFDEFDHTVVFEGTQSFRKILNLLYRVGYIESERPITTIQVMRDSQQNYYEKIYFEDPILDKSILEFGRMLEKYDGMVTLVIE